MTEHLRIVLWNYLFVSVALSSAIGLPPLYGQSSVPRQLSVPNVRVEVIGPTIVRLTAETAAWERVYQIDVRKRLEGTSAPERSMPLQGQSYRGALWSGLDSVLPGSTYRYQVMAVSGSTTPLSSEWSPEVLVRTPPPPSLPPAAPRGLSAKALGSFQVELTWQDVSDNEYGFEILKANQGLPIRVALANPNTTRFVVHGRAPGSTAAFAVRSFNPRGVSQATSTVFVNVPALSAAVNGGPGGSHTVGPCRTREAAIHDVEEAGDTDLRVLDRGRIQRLGGDLNLEVLPEPGSCGNANCNWHLYGNYAGCYRKLGELFAAGLELIGKTPAGLPLVLQLGHMSATRTNVAVNKLEKGRLVELDHFVVCENPSEVSSALSPVFDVCQFEKEIWSPRAR
jgi:hypothetical protein